MNLMFRTSLLIAVTTVLEGCATGYRSPSIKQEARTPSSAGVVVEADLWQKGKKDSLYLLIDRSVFLGRSVSSGAVECLERAGVEPVKGPVMVAVARHDGTYAVLDNVEDIQSDEKAPPIMLPDDVASDSGKTRAAQNLFAALSPYDSSELGGAFDKRAGKPVKADKLHFDPADIRALFGDAPPPVIVLVQSYGVIRAKGALAGEMAGAVVGAVLAQMLSGGQYHSYGAGGAAYPGSIKLVVVDSASGEVLWADAKPAVSNGSMSRDPEGHIPADTTYYALRHCPLFRPKK